MGWQVAGSQASDEHPAPAPKSTKVHGSVGKTPRSGSIRFGLWILRRDVVENKVVDLRASSVGCARSPPGFPGLKLKVEISQAGESRMQQRHNRRWDSGMIDSAPFQREAREDGHAKAPGVMPAKLSPVANRWIGQTRES